MNSQHALTELMEIYGALFTRSEIGIRGGDVSKTKPALLENMYKERNWHGYPTFLSSVWRDVDGVHGWGEAVDQILFKKGGYMRQPLHPLHLWTLSTAWPWMGVGMYLDWRYTNRDDGKIHRTPGIHKDIHQGGERSRPLRWVAWTLNSNGDLATLKEIQGASQTRRYFFYQSNEDGKFYNAGLGRQYSLSAIMEIWNRLNQIDA